MISTLQMTAAIAKRQTTSYTAIAELALLNAILTSIPATDPLHSRIAAIFSDDDEDWNGQFDAVLMEARKRIV